MPGQSRKMGTKFSDVIIFVQGEEAASLKLFGILALLSASLLLTACPRHVRPHPHRLPHPVLPVGSMFQLEWRGNEVMLPPHRAEPAAAGSESRDRVISAEKSHQGISLILWKPVLSLSWLNVIWRCTQALSGVFKQRVNI